MTMAPISPATPRLADQLCSFIDACPSPYHACQTVAEELREAGFTQLAEVDAWKLGAGKFYVVRGGSLVAWIVQDQHKAHTGFRILGAHTDSPNLRIKPRPDTHHAGCRQLGVEIYGGVLLNSWLDRDLGLSGRVQLREGQGSCERLFLISRPVMKIPQLAIHLDREVVTKGLLLNKQVHLQPVWGFGSSGARTFRDWLGEELDVDPTSILSWEAMPHDVQKATVLGVDGELISSARLDNLASCFSALNTLLGAARSGAELRYVPVMALFDHEEVGSGSATGAASSMLQSLLERTALVRGGNREDLHRAIADSLCISLDMAHATHPNYSERHDPDHNLTMNGGPVIKINANLRYATESSTAAVFELACSQAEVPLQKWVMRTDLACGSTIGPITAQNLGMACVDVGNPMLGMHSIRETCGSEDVQSMERALSLILI